MAAKNTFKVGVISDTHGHLEPKVFELFKGVDHIVHAGDIGWASIILELEEIAPVTAISGNNDVGMEFKETEVLQLENRKFLLHHIVDVNSPAEKIKRRIIRENPDVVIFGHTHKRYCQMHGQTLYFNPGYAGKPKHDQERSVAILTCDETGITAEFADL